MAEFNKYQDYVKYFNEMKAKPHYNFSKQEAPLEEDLLDDWDKEELEFYIALWSGTHLGT